MKNMMQNFLELTLEIGNKNFPRREREKAKHRQEIFNAAIKVFAKKGFHSATIEEIADEAEFSKGAIYTYFSNKADLLYQIMDHMLTLIKSFLRESLSGKKSFKEELIDLLIISSKFQIK